MVSKMKVLMINGSPHDDGCTATALKVVEKELNDLGVETQTIQIGDKDIRGCVDCGFCKENKKCAFDDIVNEANKLFEECDGLIIGTPVYYGGLNGTLKAFLDRLFRSSHIGKSMKLGASIASSRRAGSTSTLDDINRFFLLSNMPIVTSTYFNEVHGTNKDEVKLDEEGIQTMKNLGRNMAFLVKSINLGKENYGLPEKELGVRTNFVR